MFAHTMKDIEIVLEKKKTDYRYDHPSAFIESFDTRIEITWIWIIFFYESLSNQKIKLVPQDNDKIACDGTKDTIFYGTWRSIHSTWYIADYIMYIVHQLI